MNDLKLIEEVILNNSNNVTYATLAFDGKFYYFCYEGKNLVDIYNMSFCKIKTCNVRRPYDLICYDSKNCYFYAISYQCPDILIKLNNNLQEMSYIKLSDSICDLCPKSLSYCCSNDTIILSTKNKVFKISIIKNKCKEIFCLEQDIYKVIAVPPGYIVITENNDMYIINIYDYCFNLVNCQSVKKRGNLCDALFNPCENGSEYKCERYSNVYLLMQNECCCSYLNNIKIPYEHFKYKLNSCNYILCKDKEETCDKICPDTLIQSIALIQAGISHILNAEGEKIQKVLATSNDVNAIICVNEKVNETITKITQLEIVLYDALALCFKELKCCSCNCCKDEKNTCTCNVDGGNI